MSNTRRVVTLPFRFLCFSLFLILLKLNFVTAYRPRKKVLSNLDAKYMMEENKNKLTTQGFIILFERKNDEANQR